MGRNIVTQLRDQGIAPGVGAINQANTDIYNPNITKQHLNNLSAAGGVITAQAPSLYDINQFNTNQQMYQSFVRGTLAKKRASQYSERKAAREQERFHMQHNKAVKDFNDFGTDQK